MKSTVRIVVGLVVASALGIANVALAAQDPGCNKWNGCGQTESFGTRQGCGEPDGCHWVSCSINRGQSGGPYNDSCAAMDWCENTGAEGGPMCDLNN